MPANKRSERFKPIHNIAQQREDVAAQALGRMQRELTNHNSKLSELVKYHQDYIARFNENAVNGMSVIQVKSYQTFISQLETAIEEQKRHIRRIAEACEASRADWTVERQKSQVLEKVIVRYQKQESQAFYKQEQRNADEFVASRFWHKKR